MCPVTLANHTTVLWFIIYKTAVTFDLKNFVNSPSGQNVGLRQIWQRSFNSFLRYCTHSVSGQWATAPQIYWSKPTVSSFDLSLFHIQVWPTWGHWDLDLWPHKDIHFILFAQSLKKVSQCVSWDLDIKTKSQTSVPQPIHLYVYRTDGQPSGPMLLVLAVASVEAYKTCEGGVQIDM